MKIAFIAAGAAGMYCGSCMHDNTVAAELIELGHDVVLVPTYTPMRTDEIDVSMNRVFYGAVNVYLEQVFPIFRRAPAAVHRLLDRRGLLRWISRWAGSTDASELGALTLSILQGEEGRQRRELEELVEWLADFQPDIVHLTNSMFLGLARRIKQVLGVPVVCGLPGEDIFLSDLTEPHRSLVRAELRRRSVDVDAFLAPNRYFAKVMGEMLAVEAARMHVVPLGVRLDEGSGEPRSRAADGPFVVGYLARICPEKGLHQLVEAFRLLAERLGPDRVRLRVAGYLGSAQEAYLDELRQQVEGWGLDDSVEWLGEVSRREKLNFLQEVDVLSVPTTYRESKGLYVLEALAAGVPVVQPDHGAFPELIEATGGGLLVEAGSTAALSAGLERLAGDADLRRRLGEAGRTAVRERYHARAMAETTVALLQELIDKARPGEAPRSPTGGPDSPEPLEPGSTPQTDTR